MYLQEAYLYCIQVLYIIASANVATTSNNYVAHSILFNYEVVLSGGLMTFVSPGLAIGDHIGTH